MPPCEIFCIFETIETIYSMKSNLYASKFYKKKTLQ